MGRLSALESNNILKSSKEFETLEDKMLRLERIISDCVLSKKVTDFRKNKIVELLESLSEIRFDIGSIDNLEMLEFIKNPNGNYTVYEVVKLAHGEINPKSYGYKKLSILD